MKTNDKIRLGIIGSGNIGNVHMNIFKQLHQDVELAALTDLNYPLAQKCAAEHGIPTTYVTNTELIEDPNIDAIVIGVPNQWHASLAVQALKAGKHVLL